MGAVPAGCLGGLRCRGPVRASRVDPAPGPGWFPLAEVDPGRVGKVIQEVGVTQCRFDSLLLGHLVEQLDSDFSRSEPVGTDLLSGVFLVVGADQVGGVCPPVERGSGVGSCVGVREAGPGEHGGGVEIECLGVGAIAPGFESLALVARRVGRRG